MAIGDPGVHAKNSTLFEALTANDNSTGWHHSFERQAKG